MSAPSAAAPLPREPLGRSSPFDPPPPPPSTQPVSVRRWVWGPCPGSWRVSPHRFPAGCRRGGSFPRGALRYFDFWAASSALLAGAQRKHLNSHKFTQTRPKLLSNKPTACAAGSPSPRRWFNSVSVHPGDWSLRAFCQDRGAGRRRRAGGSAPRSASEPQPRLTGEGQKAKVLLIKNQEQ